MCIINADVPAVTEQPPTGTLLAIGSPQTSSLARGASPALPRRAEGTRVHPHRCQARGRGSQTYPLAHVTLRLQQPLLCASSQHWILTGPTASAPPETSGTPLCRFEEHLI